MSCSMPERRRVRAVAVALLSLSLLNGCFTYAPVNGTLPGPGARVRLDLEQPQEIRAGQVTATDVVQITGEIIRADTAAVAISAFGLVSRSGYEFVGSGETATVPRVNITRVRENRISVLRTAAVVGVGLVLSVLFASEVAGVRGGGGPGNGGGSTN